VSEGYLHIGNVAQRTGVPEATLRAWERRYGVLWPQRTQGGQRLYSEDDVSRVRRMRALIAGGLRAAQAAKVVGGERAAAANGDAVAALRADLVGAIADFDESAAHAVLDEVFARLTIVAAVDEVVAPALRRLGDMWAAGEVGVDAEHFGTNVIRARVMPMARAWGAGAGPLAVAACAPAEEHDLPLLLLCLGLREDGWRVRFLGARTPVDDLRRTLERDRPRLALVSASTADAARSLPEPPSLDGTVVLAGGAGYPGWTPASLRETVDWLRPHGFAA
jgi:DNA-binding transcriptional MerR regulator